MRIVHYGPDQEKSHNAFATQFWTKRKRTAPDYLYWKFRSPPKRETKSLILAEEKGRILGQLGLIPCTIEIGGERIEAQWACDLMVDNAFRGKGVARKLYEYAFALKPLTLGSDPSPAAAISMKRAGFRSIAGPRKCIFPVYLGEIGRLKGYRSELLDSVPNPFILLLRVWKMVRKSRRFQPTTKSQYLKLTMDAPSQIKQGIRVIHDESFADWRFEPFKNYYHGVDLFTDHESAYSLYQSPSTFILTDYSAPTLAALVDIWSDAVMKAYDNDVRSVKVLIHSFGNVLLSVLLGFVPFRDKTEIIFHTVDPRVGKTLLSSGFYYTYLDSDENI